MTEKADPFLGSQSLVSLKQFNRSDKVNSITLFTVDFNDLEQVVCTDSKMCGGSSVLDGEVDDWLVGIFLQ